ncbi:MAG: cob(I)yrinic acid a,c-diamide adenosyltransferase [Planctomycetota bacterium]|nr:MAG: cob(I)yrinic acid a,c-diamide adenosyltransferase [Planctomycetota bacterium]
MVKLNKIYTKSGDDGSTGLVSGSRVSKASVRVEAYGTTDEANAAIGVTVAVAEREGPGGTKRLVAVLRSLQHDLFDAGADLATPMAAEEAPGAALRITPAQTERLEGLIDEWNEPLEPLTSFVLPGGSETAATLHVARTVTRRAERLAVSLRDEEPGTTSAEVVRYLNRLSDLLFVLGRAVNHAGPGDVLWVPGANRDPA